MPAESKFDPKYRGAYGGRPLFPGDLRELDRVMRDSPWDAERIEEVFATLYDKATGLTEEYQQLRKELAALENVPGKPTAAAMRKIVRRGRELGDLIGSFESLDRRVYLCHLQMAAEVNPEWRRELFDRYRFTLELQVFHTKADEFAEKADLFTRDMQENDDPEPKTTDQFLDLMHKSWKALKSISKDSRLVEVPRWHPGNETKRLEDLLLTDKLVPEPPEEFGGKLNWAERLVNQLRSVRHQCATLHEVNVVGIVALQEKVAAAWQKAHAPIEAELEAEVLEAEVLHTGEVVEAVVAPAPLVFMEPGPAAPVAAARLPTPPPLPPAMPPPLPPPPVPAAEIPRPPTDAEMFSLDLADYNPSPAAPAAAPAIATESILTGTIVKPAKNGRPQLKITYVRPGEPSPLGK